MHLIPASCTKIGQGPSDASGWIREPSPAHDGPLGVIAPGFAPLDRVTNRTDLAQVPHLQIEHAHDIEGIDVLACGQSSCNGGIDRGVLYRNRSFVHHVAARDRFTVLRRRSH